jgi:hypothetical protein
MPFCGSRLRPVPPPSGPGADHSQYTTGRHRTRGDSILSRRLPAPPLLVMEEVNHLAVFRLVDEEASLVGQVRP